MSSETEYQNLREELEELREEVVRSKHRLIGVDGTNGVVGEMKKLNHEVEEVKTRMNKIELRFASYVGGMLVLYFFAQRYADKLMGG